jgi:methionyl-tRNA formyltransferase
MALDTKFVFFGTPQFAVYVLEELEAAGWLPALVVTAPDKPAGRGLKLTPPPVKLWAQARHIPILQLEKLNDEILHQLKTNDYTLAIVAAYGKIIPQSMLEVFPRGTLNIHPSLLPQHRGPSPIQAQILGDDPTKVGVSIMLLDDKMDHGPIIADYRLQIAELSESWPPRAFALEESLARAGGKLLAETIPAWTEGKIEPQEQNHNQATYTKKIVKDDGLVDLAADDPREIFLKLKAYDPWPGTYFFAERNGRKVRVKIKDALWDEGVLKITRVLPEDGREMDYNDWLRAG